jgi:hypothetical protein
MFEDLARQGLAGGRILSPKAYLIEMTKIYFLSYL